MTYSFFFRIEIPEERAPEMRWHVYQKGPLGWFDADRAVLMDFGIWCGNVNWEWRAAELTYEHWYDAALSLSARVGQVQLRDSVGTVLVEFNRGQVMTKGVIGW